MENAWPNQPHQNIIIALPNAERLHAMHQNGQADLQRKLFSLLLLVSCAFGGSAAIEWNKRCDFFVYALAAAV